MTKELTLRLPDHIFKVIDEFKEASGVSYTNFIYNAIYWYCITKQLLPLQLNGKKNTSSHNTLPNELKFCDGDKCQV